MKMIWVSYVLTNVLSLKTVEELKYFLDKTKIDFDVIGITESRIKKNKSPINSLNLKDYSYECFFRKSSAGGTVL